MPVEINFLTELRDWRELVKAEKATWKTLILATLPHAPVKLPADFAINVLLADNATVQRLNREYREIDKPTNILSFPQIEEWDDAEAVLELAQSDDPVLGDLILAWDVVKTEAAAQNKTIADHVAHLLVHGTLHLLGYDHLEDDEAEAMEALETTILTAHDIANPYHDDFVT